jgi:hypothetical protein
VDYARGGPARPLGARPTIGDRSPALMALTRPSLASQTVEAKRPIVFGDDIALERHAELLHDASGRRVRRVMDRDDALALEPVERFVTDGASGLRSAFACYRITSTGKRSTAESVRPAGSSNPSPRTRPRENRAVVGVELSTHLS